MIQERPAGAPPEGGCASATIAPGPRRVEPARALLAGALLWLVGGAHADPAEAVGTGLRATLEPGERPGEIVFRLVNEGAETVSVLPAGTPLEPLLSADIFLIERSTKSWPALERAAYTGRLVKRVPPVDADFVTLAPGESRSVVVPLGYYYDAPATADYRVAWRGEIDVRSPSTGTRPADEGTGAADAVRLPVRGPVLRLESGSGRGRARPAAFDGCDAARRMALDEATPAAERLVAEALRELEARPDGTLAAAPRYVRWFGPWSSAREARAKAVFGALLDTLSGTTLTYDCRCTDETLYAYVYPSRVHDVFLCPAFFRTGLLGTDSRTGTLVHELTHFPSIGGTRDHVYGHEAAATLARQDPDLAVANADSYEYFAENTPTLAMEGGTASRADGEPVESVSPDEPPAFIPLPLDVPVLVPAPTRSPGAAAFPADDAPPIRAEPDASAGHSSTGLGAPGVHWLLGGGALLLRRRQRDVLVDRGARLRNRRVVRCPVGEHE